jgi:hypothetical protein
LLHDIKHMPHNLPQHYSTQPNLSTPEKATNTQTIATAPTFTGSTMDACTRENLTYVQHAHPLSKQHSSMYCDLDVAGQALPRNAHADPQHMINSNARHATQSVHQLCCKISGSQNHLLHTCTAGNGCWYAAARQSCHAQQQAASNCSIDVCTSLKLPQDKSCIRLTERYKPVQLHLLCLRSNVLLLRCVQRHAWRLRL